MVLPLKMKSVVLGIFIQLWFLILCGLFVLLGIPEIVSCTTIFQKKNFLILLRFIFILVTINELSERGLVNFEYTKLCFSVGGNATDPKPNKIYQSARVSFIIFIL